MGKNKTNNPVSALLVGLIAAFIANLLRMIIPVQFPNAMGARLYMAGLDAIVLIVAAVVYCLAISKQKINVALLIIVPLIASVINGFLTQIMLTFVLRILIQFMLETGIDGFQFIRLFSFVISFVIGLVINFIAMFLVLNLSKDKQPNYGIYGNPYYTPNSQAQNPYNNYNSSNSPGVSSADASAASVDTDTEKNGEEENA
jgi:hypothetical protein